MAARRHLAVALGALLSGQLPPVGRGYAVLRGIVCKGVGGERLEIPPEAMNDDWCDCADGADEEETGACAGKDDVLFRCANKGATPRLIYASRVDDGICDCCDGSDEARLKARRPTYAGCSNRCAEEGELDRKAREERAEQLREGLAKKEANRAAAVVEREQWQAELARLEAELPALEAAQAEAEKQAVAGQAAPPAGAQGAQDSLEEVKSLRALVAKQQEQIDALRRDVDSLLGRSTSGDTGGAAKDGAGAAAGQAAVSEYAKWMDGAGSTPGAIQEAAGGEEEGVYDDEEEGDEDAEELGGGLGAKAATVRKASEPRDPRVEEAARKVKDSKAEAAKLRRKLEHLDEEHLGYASLAKGCLSKSDGQYTYELCFFEEARQDSVLLGRWKGWTGLKKAEFTNGQMCPGGPARMLRVVFQCGSEEEVLEITEPSRCVYEAHVTAPGACTEEEAADLQRPLERHPRDEL